MADKPDPLDHFLTYLDRLKEVMDGAAASTLAYSETCRCGGSISVGAMVSMAERRRMHGGFLAQHRDCPSKTTDLAPVLGVVAGHPCHADVLLEIANAPTPATPPTEGASHD